MRLQFESLRPGTLPGKGEAPAQFAIVGIAPSTKRPKERALEPFGAKSWAIIEGLKRLYPSMYVTNLVKEPHAPGKPPTPTMQRLWLPLLLEELSIVQPQRILTLGDAPARALCGSSFHGLREDRGTFFHHPDLDAWVVPTFHFSAGARNPTFNRFIDRDLQRFFTLPEPNLGGDYTLIDQISDLYPVIPQGADVVMDIETTGLEWNAGITQVGLKIDWMPPFLIMNPTKENLLDLGFLFKRKQVNLIGHNLQFDLRVLLFNTEMQWPRTTVDDSMILAHLSGETTLSLKHLATMYTDRPGPHAGGGPGDPLYLAEDVESTMGVFDRFRGRKETSYAYSVLRDLVPMVAGIYARGVYIDRERLKEIARDNIVTWKERRKTLDELSGLTGVNWGATGQAAEALQSVGVPLSEKTKAGNPSIREAALLPLAERYPLVKALLEFRAVDKAISGFIKPYFASTKSDPFLRPTLKLCGTETGRLSCANPNLQQVTREGPLKEIFVSRWEGGVLGLVDLDQAELRVAALLSQDTQLAQALLSEDTHRYIASRVFAKPMDQITPAERKASKKITFGVLYGGTAEGLAFKSDLAVKVVMEILHMITTEFPLLAKWMRREQRSALENGYIETLFGRRRSVDHLLKRGDQSRVRRLAVNTPTQSLASDSMLVVTRGLDKRLREKKLKSRILFGVHDSVLTEVYPNEEDAVANIVQHAFQDLNDTPLGKLEMFSMLPLTGSFMTGTSWAAVESTNAAYNPIASWSCSSAAGGPQRSLVLSKEEREDWGDDDEEDDWSDDDGE